jgi:ElaB/YqjD/DUF883 family membrane-anchored ribosome-binding protein
MFHHRPSAFATNVSAIEARLRALENELEQIGRTAGRHASAGMFAAGDHVGDAIASAVTEVVDRFRRGGRLAGEEAVRFGNEAAKFGNNALHRMASKVEHHPLVTLAVAVGVGILIGMAGGMAGRRH